MRYYLAISENSETRDDFANVLKALEADSGVVLRVSLDGSKSGRGPKEGSIEFYADAEAANRVAEKISGWRFFPARHLKDAPDNNEFIDTLGPNPAFTDYRVKQPEVTADMEQFLLVGGKAGADFNAAAVVLMKEASVRLTGWEDHTNKRDSSLSGMFTVAAKDRATVEAVARKLPQWVIAPGCR